MTDFAPPMGSNGWPVEDCATVSAESDTFLEATQRAAFSHDSAIVVHSDGTIEQATVQVERHPPAEYRRTTITPMTSGRGPAR